MRCNTLITRQHTPPPPSPIHSRQRLNHSGNHPQRRWPQVHLQKLLTAVCNARSHAAQRACSNSLRRPKHSNARACPSALCIISQFKHCSSSAARDTSSTFNASDSFVLSRQPGGGPATAPSCMRPRLGAAGAAPHAAPHALLHKLHSSRDALAAAAAGPSAAAAWRQPLAEPADDLAQQLPVALLLGQHVPHLVHQLQRFVRALRRRRQRGRQRQDEAGRMSGST